MTNLGFSVEQIDSFLSKHPMREENFPLWYSYKEYLLNLSKRDSFIPSRESKVLGIKSAICPKCGMKVIKNSFCPHCGQRLKEIKTVDLGNVTLSAVVSEVKA